MDRPQEERAMKTGEQRHAREGAGAAPRVARSFADHLDRIALLRGASRLRLEHPVTARLLGDARLGTLSQQYARWLRSRARRPTSEPASFSRFLRQLRSARADLPDLAALEEARTDVALEPPPRPIGRDALAGLAFGPFLASRLELVSALRVLVLEHDAMALWRRVSAGVPPDPPDPTPTVAVVWQDGPDVLHARLDLEEGLALEAALAGDSLVRVCAAFGRAEDPARIAFATLGSWFDEGWISAVLPPAGTVGNAA
jgi:hypothetical protein